MNFTAMASKKMRITCGCLAAAITLASSTSAMAGNKNIPDSVVISDATSPTLGRFAVQNVPSDYLIDAATGTISRVSGNGQRLTSGSTVTVPTVTIDCNRSIASQATCPVGTVMNVTITSSATGRATIPSFNIGGKTGTSIAWGNPTSTAGRLSFTVTFNNNTSLASFNLGFTVRIAATGTAGAQTLPYTVTISRP